VYQYVNWKGYDGTVGTASGVVLCIDAKDGSTVWKAAFPGDVFEFGSSSSPCYDKGRLYVIGGGAIYCLDAKTGKAFWQVPTGHKGDVNGSPVVVDGKLIVITDILRALKLDTGEEVWRCPAAGVGAGGSVNICTSPSIWTKDGKNYVITNMGKLTCTDVADGKILWQGDRADSTASPCISGDYCVVSGGASCYKLALDKPTKLWGTGYNDRGASPIIYNGYAFIFSGSEGGGTMRCLELETGKLQWSQSVPGEITSPLIVDGEIIHNTLGSVVMMAATPTQPTMYACRRIQTSDRPYCPMVADGKLYMRTGKGLGCFDLTTQQVDPTTLPALAADTPKATQPGVSYAYINAAGYSNVDALIGVAPAKTGILPNFSITGADQLENFGYRFTGYIKVPTDGVYTFTTTSDDGSKLYLGKAEVVTNDGPHGSKEESGQIMLKAGLHAYTLLYSNGTGGSQLSVTYAGPGIAKMAIPDDVLFTDK
jgi:outer membrane protein assembly factor BamB